MKAPREQTVADLTRRNRSSISIGTGNFCHLTCRETSLRVCESQHAPLCLLACGRSAELRGQTRDFFVLSPVTKDGQIGRESSSFRRTVFLVKI